MKIKIFKKVSVFILGIFLLPIIINYVLIIPTPLGLNIVGSEIDWLSFWGTYLGGIIGAFVSFTILYLTLLHNKKEAEIERVNNALSQLKKDLSERLSDINYMPLYINIYSDIDTTAEIERLNVLQGIYQQKMFTARFIYENGDNEFAKQFYDAYSKFIFLYDQQINTFKQILLNEDKNEIKILVLDEIKKLPITQYVCFKSVNDTALKYYQSEKKNLELLKTGFL